jgi:Glycosyltransferase family 87
VNDRVLGISNTCTADGHLAGAGTRALRRTAGILGLSGVLVSTFLLCAGAAAAPTMYVPGRSGGWPAWMAGPLRNLGLSLGSSSFQTLTLVMAGSYLLVLLCTRALPMGALAGTIVAAHAILLLGPPLISQDVFGYLGFARLGALHGLDPYTNFPVRIFSDPVYPFLGWPYQHSPYGPLFTLGSYAIAQLGLAGGLWAFKAVAVLSSLGAVALVGRAAGRLGHSRRWAVAFLGLNPVLLELAVGGAHNDTLVMLLLALALALTASAAAPRYNRASASLVAAVAVKASAGLVLPYLLLAPAHGRERLRALGAALLSLAALAALAAIGFGTHAFGFLSALREQQQLVAVHSIPAETARLFGLSGTPTWWRNVLLGGFLAVLLFTLWRTWRGAEWRAQAGWATLALLLATAWLLPWYAIWALPLAAVSSSRRLRAATLVFCAYALLIHLPLAKPLLSPPRQKHAARVRIPRTLAAPARSGRSGPSPNSP